MSSPLVILGLWVVAMAVIDWCGKRAPARHSWTYELPDRDRYEVWE